MHARHLPFVALFLMVAAFAALNWSAMETVISVNLLVATIQAPVGGVILSMLIAVALVFSVNMMVWQASILAENRKHTKELQQQRMLADQAEVSRFTELNSSMRDQFLRLSERIDQTEGAIRADIAESGNATLATLAELDDRLIRRRAPATD